MDPIFTQDGVSYFFLRQKSLYVVSTSRFNSSPSLIFQTLSKICNAIKDLCGDLNEDVVRKNFVLIYEVLDEMLDFGYPQIMKT